MSKSKKPKKNQKRLYRSLPHKVTNLSTLLYRKITIKWLPRTDEFQVYLDMIINSQPILILGTIDPDSSYADGIRIYCKKPVRWMTCNDIRLSSKDAPNFFETITQFIHKIGDLLDSESDESGLPSAIIYNEGKFFSDLELPNLFKLIT